MCLTLQNYDKEYEVLHSKFDFATHKATFTNYCEVVILEDGTIEYAVPSHDQKMLAIAAKKHGMTTLELIDRFAQKDLRNYYYEICSMESRCILVTNHFCRFFFIPNNQQLEALRQLIANDLIDVTIFDAWHKNIDAYEKTVNNSYWQTNIAPKINAFFD